ncbi:competence protein ComEC [Candidatus Magnetomoraceae bacterium gMMP-1]
MRFPILPPLAICFVIGIILAYWLPGYKAWWPAIIITIIIIYNIYYNNNPTINLFFLFIFIGYISLQPYVEPSYPKNHVVNFMNDAKWKITGIIDERPQVYPSSTRFILKIESLAQAKIFKKVQGKISVNIRKIIPNLFYGDRVLFFSKIRSCRNFNNPGGFDYKNYMAFKGISGLAYVSGKRLEILAKNSSKSKFKQWIENLRNSIADLIDLTYSRESKNVLKALIIGDKSGISPSTYEAFRRAGAAHLLAISGLHIGIIASIFFFIFRLLLTRFKIILHHAWADKGAAFLSFFPILIYGLIAGMSPSTQRAVIMTSCFLAAFLVERERDSIHTLFIAAIIILIIHPPSLFSISFQLSFSAVFFILYGLNKLSKFTFHKKFIIRFTHKIMVFIFVSLLALIGTLPLTLFYFNETSLISLISNLIFIPVIGFMVVPSGLIGAWILPLNKTVAVSFIQISSFFLERAIEIIHAFSSLSFASMKSITPNFLEIFLYYSFILTIFNLKHKRIARYCMILIIIASFADLIYWTNQRFRHNDLKITVLDVGQGNSALLEFPKGPCMLIDGGGFSGSRFDFGERVVGPFLWRKKIRTVEILVLTHPHSDHLNGLLFIARHFNVKEIWSNKESVKTKYYQEFMNIAQKNEILMPDLKDLKKQRTINGVDLKVIYPPLNFIECKEIVNWRNINNNSLVLKIYFKYHCFLFPGDIMKDAEYELSRTAGNDLKSTLIIAPHHGSKSSSTEIFLEKVKPNWCIISLGWNNRFGFPHACVLKRYKDYGCKVFRTDQNGAVMIETDGKSMKIKPYLN